MRNAALEAADTLVGSDLRTAGGVLALAQPPLVPLGV
jgi:hypothetical protein